MLLKHLQHVQHSSMYFCNIKMKQLQHTSETSETLKTYICNIGERKGEQQQRSRASNSTMASATDLRWDLAAGTCPVTCGSGRRVPLRSCPGQPEHA
jgi:hypothetical protein